MKPMIKFADMFTKNSPPPKEIVFDPYEDVEQIDLILKLRGVDSYVLGYFEKNLNLVNVKIRGDKKNTSHSLDQFDGVVRLSSLTNLNY